MFPDPLFAVSDAIPQATLTVLPALLAGPGAVAIVVLGAVAIAAVATLVRGTRTRVGPSASTATTSPRSRLARIEDAWADVLPRAGAGDARGL
jgi:hypothetical protein